MRAKVNDTVVLTKDIIFEGTENFESVVMGKAGEGVLVKESDIDMILVSHPELEEAGGFWIYERDYLSKLDMLWIRACKSENPNQRIKSIYRRFFLRSNKPEAIVLFSLIMPICNQFKVISVSEFAEAMSPEKLNLYGLKNESYWDCALSVIISKIRLEPIPNFKGLTMPGSYRKKYGKH